MSSCYPSAAEIRAEKEAFIRDIPRLYAEIIQEDDQLKTEWNDIFTTEKSEYDALKPTVAIPATKEELKDAYDTLTKRDAEFHAKWNPKFEEIYTKRKHHIPKLCRFVGRLDELRNNRYEDMLQEVYERRHAALFQQEKNPELTSDDHDNRLQAVMHSLVEGQTQELREWFFSDCLCATSHLDLKESSKPTVEVKNRSDGFPPEIAALVFSYLDLESCVALREANTSWFTAFQGSEHVLRDKLRQRNPWMRPEGDLDTWADCVLVFVKRLASWTSVTSLDEIKVKSNPIKPKINIKAVDLNYKEKLPEDFVYLKNHCHNCTSYCSRLHLTHDMDRDDWANVPVDPEYTPDQCEVFRKTHDMSDGLLYPTYQALNFGPLEQLALVGEEDDGLVYRAYGVEMTLPKYVRPEHLRKVKQRVQFLDNHVIVRTTTSTLIFPRGRNLLHYKNAAEYPGHFEDIVVGHVYVGYQAETKQYMLLDPCTPQFVPFGKKRPLAFYNGLIWYAISKDVIPTFMDLETGKYYYKQEAVISTNLENCLYDWSGTQVPKAPFSHLVIQSSLSSLNILDLRTGLETCIQDPDYDEGAAMERLSSWFPGYVGDKFHLRRISREVTKQYTMDAYGLQEHELDDSWHEDRWSQMESIDPLTFFA